MKNIMLSFMTPPGLALLGAIGLMWFFKVHRFPKKTIAILLGTLIITVWVPSTMAFARFLSFSLLSQVHGRSVETADHTDLIVVLTRGMYKAENVGWLPTSSSYRRMAVAYELQKLIGSRTPILISGGRTAGVQYPSEAKVLAQYFDRFQAQYTPIILEETSTDTYESSLQVGAIMEKREIRNIFLITDEVHMLRSLAAYRARGIDPIPFPSISLPIGQKKITDYLPSAEGAKYTSHALYEFYGLISYFLSGRIKWSDISYKTTESL